MDFESETLIAHALRADGFDASEDGTGRGTPIVPVQAFYSTESRCDNIPPVAPPLKIGSNGGGQPPAVAFSCKDHGADAGELAPTLRSMGHDDSHANGGGQVAVAFTVSAQANGFAWLSDVHPTIQSHPQSDTSSRQMGVLAPVAFQEAQTGVREYETAGSLRANGPGHDPVGTRVRQGYAVRRLTVVECNRLQGFEDTYTFITRQPRKIDADEAEYLASHGLHVWQDGEQWMTDASADGPMYKAIGNSMARPVMEWIGRRIDEVMAN